MRKAGIIILALFLVLVSSLVSFAGTLNPDEMRVIDSASGTFEYQGEQYVATGGSLSQMTAYLNQDGVDLTSVQADRAIQLMHYESNVKTAIDGGYLVSVNGSGDGDDGGNDGNGAGPGDGSYESGDDFPSDQGALGPDGSVQGSFAKPGFVQIMFSEGQVAGFDSEGDLVFEAGLPVKNTGYDVSWLLIPVVILAALLTGLLVYVKKEIRFLVVPLVFVLLLGGIVGTVGASAKNRMLASVEAAMILGASETDILPGEEQSATAGLQDEGTLPTGAADIPSVGALYGNLACDAVELSVPLYFGDDGDTLEKGAGQYVMSGIPGEGRPILVGGHDASFFAPLEHIQKGDAVEVTTGYGKYVYIVTRIKIESVEKWQNETLEDDQETLILYTCHPFGSVFGAREDRLYVICEKVLGPIIADGALNR